MFAIDYYYGDQRRWDLGLGHPGVAGVAVAFGIIFLWTLQFWLVRRQDRTGRLVLACTALSEVVLFAILCKTYSRGPLLSLLVVGGMAWMAASVACHSSLPERLARLGARCGTYAAIVMATGVWGRIDPEFVAGDHAVLNRLELWKGGMQLVGASPWVGWHGYPGDAYGNWFRPLDLKIRVLTLSNGYLTLAAQHGLLLLGGVIVVCTLGLARAARLLARHGTGSCIPWNWPIVAGAFLSLLQFLGANLFSDYFRSRVLLAAASAFLVVLLVVPWPVRDGVTARRIVTGAGLASLAALMLLYSGAGVLLSNNPLVVRRTSDAVMVMSRISRVPERHVAFLTDPRVVGPEPGTLVRQVAEQFGSVVHPIAVDGWTPPPECSAIWCFGSSFRQLRDWGAATFSVVVIHPLGLPPGGRWRPDLLVLPRIDHSLGNDSLWREWAAERGVPTFEVSGAGRDIRPAWGAGLVEQIWSSVLAAKQSYHAGEPTGGTAPLPAAADQ